MPFRLLARVQFGSKYRSLNALGPGAAPSQSPQDTIDSGFVVGSACGAAGRVRRTGYAPERVIGDPQPNKIAIYAPLGMLRNPLSVVAHISLRANVLSYSSDEARERWAVTEGVAASSADSDVTLRRGAIQNLNVRR